MNSSRSSALALALLTLTGCGKENARVEPPAYNGDAGAAALTEYDKNRDGVISGQELRRAPGLLAAMNQIDTDGNKKISAEEIDARIRKWQESQVGESPVRCRVMLDDAPLTGARVVFEPEPFLGPNVHPASGTTGAGGTVGISMAPEHLADPKFAGVANGWYKIRITCDSKPIPASYNTETILGCEVAMDAHWVSESEIVIEMKSK